MMLSMSMSTQIEKKDIQKYLWQAIMNSYLVVAICFVACLVHLEDVHAFQIFTDVRYDRRQQSRTRNVDKHKRSPPSSSSSSSSSPDSQSKEENQAAVPSFNEDSFTAMQKATSTSTSTSTSLSQDAFDSEAAHLQHQQKVFDDLSDFFASDKAIPAEIVPAYQFIAAKIIADMIQMRSRRGIEKRNRRNITGTESESEVLPLSTFSVLDVACGSGALFEFLVDAANEADISLNITGVDLSPAMVDAARNHASTIIRSEKGIGHNICVVEAHDILQYTPEADDAVLFDAVIANACFGNFWDPLAVLTHVSSTLLKMDGSVFLTHPLGAGFVEKLHREDPRTVPHLMPSVEAFQEMITCLPLQLADFVEQFEGPPGSKNHESSLYFLSATRVRHRALASIIRLRGTVDSGYGRGGKKLGFPTANLPSNLFQDALTNVSTGVYYGWALVEDPTKSKKGRNVLHKAVVNVGYSPTFEGKENKEKIVEAHLMFADDTMPMDPPDFYNETMRLQLHGYLRPEIKFASFPALVAQITTDAMDAQEILDSDMSTKLRAEAFLQPEKTWIGIDGGNDQASWEFERIDSALGKVL